MGLNILQRRTLQIIDPQFFLKYDALVQTLRKVGRRWTDSYNE